MWDVIQVNSNSFTTCHPECQQGAAVVNEEGPRKCYAWGFSEC